MPGYNLPDDCGPMTHGAPWFQTREPVQDEECIREALEELFELKLSLRYIDRHNPADSHFKGYRGGPGMINPDNRASLILAKS